MPSKMPLRPRDTYWERLKALKDSVRKPNRSHVNSLPQPVEIGLGKVIRRIFPWDGLLMMTSKPNYHPVRLRNQWLSGRYHLPSHCYCSSNYCSTDQADGTSYHAFAGIERRWLVIESDQGSLEQQFWIHKELEKQFQNLGLVCWSGEKSLHGWYLVEGWSQDECFQLYSQAIHLGVNDCATWKICQQCRLPLGWNWKTKQRQLIYVWNI
jgi:hypothetical protein